MFTSFCDAYTNTIYPWISDGLGFIMDKIPINVGEILMYGAALWLLAVLIRLLLFPFLCRRVAWRMRTGRVLRRFLTATMVVCLVYVISWIIPFHASYICFPETDGRGYNYLEVEALRNWVIEGLNEAANACLRDEDGYLVVPDALEEDVVAAMQAMADEFPRLSGYYPRLKQAYNTEFMQWMRIGGYTFPYTMELMGNGYDMIRLYYPTLYAHESSHHQGYYQEDEADFLAYMALSRSKNPYLRYSAFYQMYYVVEPAFRSAAKTCFPSEEDYLAYLESLVAPDPVFSADLNHDYEIFKTEYDKHVHPPKKLQTVSEKVADKGWSMQEDILKEKYYSGSLKLMLDYYYK